MTDDQWTAIMFGILLCIGVGMALGSYAQSFSIPSCKIWESDRTYDKILIADTVVCKPAVELNTTYYRYDVANYNGIDYVVQKMHVSNTTAKGMIVCEDG